MAQCLPFYSYCSILTTGCYLYTNVKRTATVGAGWVSDSTNKQWPMQIGVSGCGGPGISIWDPGAAGAICYGVIPSDINIWNFYESTNAWNKSDTSSHIRNSPLVTYAKNLADSKDLSVISAQTLGNDIYLHYAIDSL